MAYELFSGSYPFDTSNIGLLLNQIINVPVDATSIGVSNELAEVLEKLLAKTREERYRTANEVIHALCEASGQPAPSETFEIRESYLQAAKFVGRDAELDQLSAVARIS